MSDKAGSVKCVVWDLDDTLWRGVLLEDQNVTLRPDISRVIETLDQRGILQSIASRNDYDTAIRKLADFGLHEYFLYPQINWNSKSDSIQTIAKSINIGLDTIAFVDDQPFERDEVNYSLPQVSCIDAREIPNLLELPAMNPRFITEDSQRRRQMYLSDIRRNEAEQEFKGASEEFLASLDMELEIFPAEEKDLQRAEELTVRTNQLNATGYTYSYEELNHFRQSDDYRLLMARLEDKYGSYGHIGLALIECGSDVWTIKLLLMSCRVMSRGVGSIMLTHIMNLAKAADARLQAQFVPTDRNRMMNITYRFAGFKEVDKDGEVTILENDLSAIPRYPDYVKLLI